MGADSKPVNSRTYSTTVSTGDRDSASIRTGSRVPIATGPSSGNANVQFQYIDLGVNMDVRNVRELDRQLTLDHHRSQQRSRIHRSNPPPMAPADKWHSVILMPIGKPTVVFSSDSVDGKGSMQVVVTATPIE